MRTEDERIIQISSCGGDSVALFALTNHGRVLRMDKPWSNPVWEEIEAPLPKQEADNKHGCPF